MYPLFTPIPYTLRITTITKPMKKDEVDKMPQKPLFPTPPNRPSEVQFRLRRYIWLKAHWFTAVGDEDVTALGGLEIAASAPASNQSVDVRIGDKEWIPSESDKNMGTYLQETTFASAFSFTCPPTFRTDIMRVNVRNCLPRRI